MHATVDKRRAVEMWFRRRGLPMVVRQKVKNTTLAARATPALLFLALIEPLLAWLTQLLGRINVKSADTAHVLGLLALALAIVVVPIAVSWFAAWVLRRQSDRVRLVVGIIVLLLAVVGLPLVQKQLGQIRNLPMTIGIYAASAAVVLILTLLGAGSILAWTLRVAVRQISAVGTLASRALPLLLLFILFSFFATETWQVSEKLEEGGRRFHLWMVIGLFVLLGALFLVSILRDEGREALAKHRAANTKDYVAVLWQTPLDGLVPDDDDAVRNYPLTRPEKINLALVMFLAQALQAIVFSVVVFWFLVVFGLIAVNDSVVEAWLGHPPNSPGRLFTLPLPGISDELIRVSLFLSGFSGMYFAASIATDSTYRKSFFDPLLHDVAVSLAARDVYLTLWNGSDTLWGYPGRGPLVVEGDLEWQKTP